MIGATATATEMQNNFGRYLNLVMEGREVIVTKNGKEVGRFVPKEAAVSYLTDSLTGILKGRLYQIVAVAVHSETGVLKGDYELDQIKEERLKEKYEITD